MTEEPPRPVDPRPSLRDVVLAAAGASLEVATGGAAGTVVGAVVPPLLGVALRADAAAQQRRLDRVARTMEVAASELGDVRPARLEELVLQDDARTELLARVLQASACAATAQEKVDALGRVLALGVTDGDRLDEALVLAAALADLEAPHVKVLAHNARYNSRREQWHHFTRSIRHDQDYTWAWSLRDVEYLAGGSAVAPAVVSVLVRHGLVEQLVQDRKGINGPERHYLYDVTEVGVACLNLLQVQPPPSRHRVRR